MHVPVDLKNSIVTTILVFFLVACSPAPDQPQVAAITEPASALATQAGASASTAESETNEAVASYGLSGRLVLIQHDLEGNRLVELILEAGRTITLFTAPQNSWLAEAVVSPDGEQILLAYAPPAPRDKPQFGYTDLYLMPYQEGAQPEAFLARSEDQESYFFPSWALDGSSIYYTHLHPNDPNTAGPAFRYDIETAVLNGESKVLIRDAVWLAISPDGSKLAYLHSDPSDSSNELYLADADGSAGVPVFDSPVKPIVDAHLFAPDGDQLIFSMVNLEPAPASTWLEKLFGVRVASAHNVPSDWYRVSLTSGRVKRLTTLNEVNLNGDLSPDGSRMAFIASSGLYVVNLDGSNLIQLSEDRFVGTVDWIP
jgi:Tol biopolymer transport system component